MRHSSTPAADSSSSCADLSPALFADALRGVAWFNGLTATNRYLWLTQAGSARPVTLAARDPMQSRPWL